jgi:signal transduction histidine kinase
MTDNVRLSQEDLDRLSHIQRLNASAIDLLHSDPQRALALTQQAYELSMRLGDRGGLSDSLHVQARVRRELGQIETALSQALESLALKEAERHPLKDSTLEGQSREHLHALETLRRQNEYLAALHDMSLGLLGRLEVNGLLEALVARAGQLLGLPHGFIYLAAPAGDELVRRIGVGIFNEDRMPRLKPGEGLSGRVYQTGQPLVVNDYAHWSGRPTRISPGLVHAMIGAPLHSGAKVIGVLVVASEGASARGFGDEDVELLSRFAQLASIALDNARLFEETQHARKAAEAASESKSAFLNSVSHELRTPLTSVLGFAHIIQKRLEEHVFPAVRRDDAKAQRVIEQVRTNIDIIISEGERLTTLINNLLDLAKIEAGEIDWRMQALDIADVIDHALAATAALFEQKNLRVVRDIADALPPIVGDHDRLIQVLINLLSNAVKFTASGSVTCRAAYDGGEIVVSVIDTGIGIAAPDQTTIFEKFRQVGDTLTGKPQGTGLGLPICKEIVEHHHGRIWIKSEGVPGKGSTFGFALPIAAGVARDYGSST